MNQQAMQADDPHARQKILHRGAAVDEAAAAVIAVHGRGATAEDILSLHRFADRADVAWLAPQAASFTWYPNSFLVRLSENEPWLSSALGLLKRLTDDLEKTGLARDRVLLCGFSQGACLASEFVARQGKRWGGLVLFSGGLIGSGQGEGPVPDDKLFEYDDSLEGTPVFVGCSDVDPHIPHQRVDRTADVLAGLGADVTKRIYPGMGHTINDDELSYLRRFVDAL